MDLERDEGCVGSNPLERNQSGLLNILWVLCFAASNTHFVCLAKGHRFQILIAGEYAPGELVPHAKMDRH